MPFASLPSPTESCIVYTPDPVAEAIVDALLPANGARWLEPSVGAGVFLRALARRAVAPKSIVALDLARPSQPSDVLATTTRPTEFLSWAHKTTDRFDRILGNPPYVAVRSLPEPLRSAAANARTPNGIPAGLRSNLWYAFVCAALQLMRPGAILGMVLPAAWDYADYAAPLRNELYRYFRSVSTYRSHARFFDDVQDGAVVLIARGFGEGPGSSQHAVYARAAALLRSVRRRGLVTAKATQGPRSRPFAANTVPFGSLVDIRIGCVTGDVEYFLLSETRRKHLNLPTAACVPILSSAFHLSSTIVDRRRWERLRANDEPVWLFRPPRRLLDDPSVRRYLSLSVSRGGCRKNRLKIQQREHWYRPVLPRAPSGFLSGMSRHGPWIALNEFSGLTATNTLYVTSYKRIVSKSDRAAHALSLLTSTARRQIQDLTRRYPDGLLKVEPGDLAAIMVPIASRHTGALSTYRSSVRCLLANDLEGAMRIADAWFHQRNT